MQQPLLRHVSRALVGTIRSSVASNTGRQLSTRPAIRASTCIQCRFRIQQRTFADDSKTSTPKTPTELFEAPNSSRSPNTAEDDAQSPSELPSASELRRSAVSKRFSHLMDNVQGNIFLASQRINDLTGYSGIEALKQSIGTMEAQLADSQESVRAARLQYKTTVADRAASQREVTTLLARKDTWTPIDLERFTNLYRSDHGNEHAVQEAATKLADTERLAEQAASKLSSSILARYHEEQIWSDKIRRMSTWGTWGLMGVNVLLFLVFQFGFEPWRRARLVRGFEDKVREALENEKKKQDKKDLVEAEGDTVKIDAIVAAGIQEFEAEAGDNSTQDPAFDALAAVIESETKDSIKETQAVVSFKDWKQPETWKLAVLELFSDQRVSLKRQDITLIAIEGAAAGATLVGLVTVLILRPR